MSGENSKMLQRSMTHKQLLTMYACDVFHTLRIWRSENPPSMQYDLQSSSHTGHPGITQQEATTAVVRSSRPLNLRTRWLRSQGRRVTDTSKLPFTRWAAAPSPAQLSSGHRESASSQRVTTPP